MQKFRLSMQEWANQEGSAKAKISTGNHLANRKQNLLFFIMYGEWGLNLYGYFDFLLIWGIMTY